MLTPEQREAAIEALKPRVEAAIRGADLNHLYDTGYGEGFSVRVAAASALDALTDAGFVVLHRDDVTEEHQTRVVDREGNPLPPAYQPDDDARERADRFRPDLGPHRVERRTITTHVGPWTTQETP